MNAGDMLLFRAHGFLPKLISWGTNSPYSHVAVCVDPGKNLLIEAQVRVRANDIRKMKDYDVFRIRPEHYYDLNKVVSFLVDKLNNKYDYKGVAFLGLMKLLRLKRTANKWQKKNDYFCSELVYESFNAGGLDIVPKVPAADITSPGDIARSEVLEKIV